MKRFVSGILFALLLLSMFTSAFNIQGRSVDASLPSRSSSNNSDPSALVPIVDTFTTVMESNTTLWDTVDINSPYVFYDAGAGLYKMWYTALSEPTKIGLYVDCRFVIAYAESNDGLTWFNKQVVHDTGVPVGNFYYTGDPFVLKENGTYIMWHFDRWEWVAGDWSRYIARMSSSDGVSWPVFMSSGDQKVLSALGQTNPQGDGNSVCSPSIIYEPGAGYVLWYSVADHYAPGSGGPFKIWRATSSDGIAWSNRQLSLPYVSSTWEGAVNHPSVVKEVNGIYTMFYEADGSYSSIGIAESLDGVSWTNRTQFLKPSDLGTNITSISTPFQFQDRDGNRYLYFTYYDGKAKFGRVQLASLAPWGNWSHYHNYTEIINTLLYLNDSYPNIVDVFSIGESWQNRDIYYIRLTNESNTNPKPQVFFVGYHHAREPITAELALYFIVYAVTNFGTNITITQMLNYSEIYIVPALNVDGIDLFRANDWQRKNARPTDEDGDGLVDEDPPEDANQNGFVEELWNLTNGHFIRWEGIDNDGDGQYGEDWVGGVDLNRNYDFQWQGGSSDPKSEIYKGPAPFSEPETQAIRNLVLSHNFTYAISFHSGDELILYPWAYTYSPSPDEAKFAEIAQDLSLITGGTTYEQSSDLYISYGTWEDWMYGTKNIFALTCEIFTNDTFDVIRPGPYPNTIWEGGIRYWFNPFPNGIETLIHRWLPVFFNITNRAIAEARALDWWPMFHHDPSHTGTSTSTGPNTNNTPWNYTTSGYVESSPAVVGGFVYVGSLDGNVYCLNATNGAPIWIYPTSSRGVLSSPAVVGGFVYVASWYTTFPPSPLARGSVYCLNATNGTLVWNYTTGGIVWSSPAVGGGLVYVGSLDGNVYCLNATNGAPVWIYPTGAPVWSSPAVGGGFVYVGSDGHNVYCLNAATGSLFWSYKTGGQVSSSPAVVGGVVYVGSDDNKVYAFGPVHDVVVTNVASSKTVVGRGFSASINVTVANQGSYTETFNVTAYANATTIATKEVTLTSGNSTTITFTWNTTGFAKGNYTISAYAWPVPGETSLTDGWVLITKVGDLGGSVPPHFFNCDGVVDGKDLALFLQCYHGTAPPEAMYPGDLGGGVPPQFFNCDGKVDGKDLALFLQCYRGLGP